MINGIVMWISFMILWSWIPTNWKRRIVGYGFAADIAVHVILQGLFGGDGEGRIAMLFGGVLINLTLKTYRKIWGCQKLTAEGWQPAK